MQGLLAAFRLPDALRGLWVGVVPVPRTVATRTDGVATVVPSETSVTAATSALDAPLRTAAAPAPLAPAAADAAPAALAPTAPAPVEPAVRVAAAHLVDPVGLRVVPYRPVSRWPLRRAAPRVLDPFRGFPQRSQVLADLMYGPTRR